MMRFVLRATIGASLLAGCPDSGPIRKSATSQVSNVSQPASETAGDEEIGCPVDFTAIAGSPSIGVEPGIISSCQAVWIARREVPAEARLSRLPALVRRADLADDWEFVDRDPPDELLYDVRFTAPKGATGGTQGGNASGAYRVASGPSGIVPLPPPGGLYVYFNFLIKANGGQLAWATWPGDP